MVCRRKQLTTTAKLQNTTRMLPAITVKRPSIMTVGSMRRQPIMLTLLADTLFMPGTTLKRQERLTPRSMEKNNSIENISHFLYPAFGGVFLCAEHDRQLEV
jgi:hypothetical protein